MEVEKINKLLKRFYESHEEFRGCKIELINDGNNRSTYLLETKNGKKLIAKKDNDNTDPSFPSKNDIKVKGFLNSVGCDFVPEVIYGDKENDFYVESYVGDENIKFNDLNDEMLEAFIKQLTEIHKLTINQFEEYCSKNGFEKPEIMTPLESIKSFGFDRFEIAEKSCTDKNVISWLKEYLNKNFYYLKTKKVAKDSAHLTWGDIGENLRISGNKLYFVGWEFSRIGFGSELSYIKIHSHTDQRTFNKIVSLYSKYSGTAEKELYEAMDADDKITRVNDVVWAAMKWGQSETEEDKVKYKTLTYERIKLAEKLFLTMLAFLVGSVVHL